MKKIQMIINVVLVAGLISLAGYHMVKKDKTVYVDINKLMQEYKGMKAARAEYEEKAVTWQANADTLIAQFQEELKIYEKERGSMSKKERELKEELLPTRALLQSERIY